MPWVQMPFFVTQLSHCWSRFRINPFLKLWNNRSTRHLPHEREFGFRNPGNFCLYNPESGKFLLVMIRNRGKFLLVQSGIEEIFACTIRNRGNFCLYNPQSRKFLLVQSGIGKIFAYGIRNPGIGNPEYVAQEMWNLESSTGRRVLQRTQDHITFFRQTKLFS